MYFHHGQKLRKLVERSPKTIVQIVEQSGITRSSLYNFFDYEEIPRKKLTPVLAALEIDMDAFLAGRFIAEEEQPAYTMPEVIEALRREIELLKQQIAAKDEIIALLKSKTKK